MVRNTRRAAAVLSTVCALLAHPHPLAAQRLPLRTYTTTDGLTHDRVKRIVWDPRGFLWLCTPRGLARFDGSRFVVYGTEEGLPFLSVNDLVVSRDGSYWIGSNGGGVIRFDATARPSAATRTVDPGDPDLRFRTATVASRFRAFVVGHGPAANRVNVLVEDRGGRLWVGTDDGLFVLRSHAGQASFSRVDLPGPARNLPAQVWALLEDREGSLWIGSTAGLSRRLPDGRMLHYVLPADARAQRRSPSPGFQREHLNVWSLAEDDDKRVWVGHATGLSVLVPEPAASLRGQELRLVRPAEFDPMSRSALPRAPGQARTLSERDGMPPGGLRAVLKARDGRLWAAGAGRLIEIAKSHFRSYGPANGLTRSHLIALAEDGGGNLWLGSARDGAVRLARSGFMGFGDTEGVGENATGLVESRAGELFAFVPGQFLARFDGVRFRAVLSDVRSRQHPVAGSTAVLQDHTGEWWIATRTALFRYTKANRPDDLLARRPKRVYTTDQATADSYIHRLFEDSRGDIWIGTFRPGRDVLTRWERSTDRFVRYSDADGLPAFHAPWAFQEDKAGNLWVGFRDGGLARYRGDRFTVIRVPSEATTGSIAALLTDISGPLWFGSENGLWRIDAPGADSPTAVRYATVTGVVTQRVLSLVQDEQRRLYVGLDRGVDRIEPLSGRVEHYTTADGLMAEEIRVAYRDRNGALWLGGLGGLARLIPDAARTTAPPRVALSGIRLGNRTYVLSELGETSVALGTLARDENRLTVSFFGPTWISGELLRYQYKLEGADRAWSEPAQARDVRYARLSPGRYRFVVRAIDSRGQISPMPASVTFDVLPPVWRRWWFLLVAATLTGLLIHAGYRRRLARVVELERLRTRIATDLHDELGSTLAEMAILAEVARQRTQPSLQVDESLARIAAASRESIDSMSDIVWAIDPERDSAQDLAHRMRRLASDLLAPRNITIDFAAPDGEAGVRLDAELRRDMYLVYKESLTNLVRHSGCTTASLRLAIIEHTLVLSVRDNGKGFNPEENGSGLGLRSMRERAGRLGGTLLLDAAPGRGTAVTLRVPLRGRPSSRL